MDRNKILQESLTRIKTAYEGNVPDRVPIVLSMHPSYLAQYYGYSVVELFSTKPELVAEMYKKAFDEFGYDALSAVNNMIPVMASEPLGGGQFTLHESGIQASNHGANNMSGSDEEYAFAEKDFYQFCRDIILPRRYSKLTGNNDESFAALKGSHEKFLWYMKASGQAQKDIEAYGCPIMFNIGNMVHPLDLIMNYFRDFTGIITDLRRKPEIVKKTAKSLAKQLLDSYSGYPASDQGKGVMWGMHLASYLKPKDFYEIYWPYMKEMLETMIQRRVFVWVFMEGNWEPYLDILQELPDNNRLVGIIEYCDYKKFKEKLGGKMAISGGLPINILAHRNKQECEDYTKKLIDDCAGGGGYILDVDKMLINKGDASPENIKAVINITKEYGKY